MNNNETMTVSLYLYKMYKSKYLEENKDVELNQDDINKNMDSKKLLYLFNTDLPKGDYLEKLKKFGTEVKVNGYNYNMNKIAEMISKITTGKYVSPNSIVITNNEIGENEKIVSVFDTSTYKTYKLTINNNNKILIIPRKFNSYGVNMLCMAEVEDIKIDNEFLVSVLVEALNKNGGYITDIRKLFLFKDYIPMSFIRKWIDEDMLVSIVVEDYYDFDMYDCYEEFDNPYGKDGEDF